ncbi:MAG: Methionyl-tRNA formyltransferase [Microgenomates bacterium OLB22]|nr:MAG: Methionyl-tRNA formyltransferase [Microgenomates bacterium OLB22]
MKPLRIGFAGTPEFAATFLELLIRSTDLPIDIQLVLTQEDKPVGRKKILTASPVKVCAGHHNIPVFHTFEELTGKLGHLDLILVFAFGAFIPSELLSVPRLGWWNIHPSLLPLYRGPSPTAYPIMMGDSQTGVTLIKLDEKMDHGPIIAQESLPVAPNMTRDELEKAVVSPAAILFLNILKNLPEGASPEMREQEHERATITRLMKREHGFIPFELLAEATNESRNISEDELPHLMKEYVQRYDSTTENKMKSESVIYNYWRALHPWPGIWTEKDGKRIKIIACELRGEKLHITAIQIDGGTVSDNKRQISQIFEKKI